MSTPQNPKEQVIHLYQGAKRIQPKLAKGRFANLRILAIIVTQFVFYVLPWFNWSGRQMVLLAGLNAPMVVKALQYAPAAEDLPAFADSVKQAALAGIMQIEAGECAAC